MQKISIDFDPGFLDVLVDEPTSCKYTILLAHGAGAGMEHSFMQMIAEDLVQLNCRVVRFNFPYMQMGKKLPGSARKDIAAIESLYHHVSRAFPDQLIILGGKSYGGRMNSHFMSQNPDTTVKGLVYFGFPLHAPGKPSIKKAAHLYDIKAPQLFLQGEKDRLADIELMRKVANDCKNAQIEVFIKADHSFKVPKSNPELSQEKSFLQLAKRTTYWLDNIVR